MSGTLERLDAIFAVIRAEAQANPDFARRLDAVLGDLPHDSSAETAKRPHRRKPGVLDPYALYERGEEHLRQQLAALDIEQLKDIVAEHAMDRSRLALKWKTADRFIDLIITTVAARTRKGDAFRG